MTNGLQLTPATEPFQGLNSTSTATWYGPTLGFGVNGPLHKTALNVHGFFTGITSSHKGRANWNLRTDFQQDLSFKHWDFGYGIAEMIKLVHPIGNGKLYITSGSASCFFAAEDGKEELFFADRMAHHTI